MSVLYTTDQSEELTTQAGESPSINSPLHVWPAVVMLAIFWAFIYANHNVDMAMFVRFISRMIAYSVLLLFFLGWWFTRRTVPWRDRFLALGVVILAGIAASFAADKSMNAFAFFLASFPAVFTVWTAWFIVARSWSPAIQRTGFCAAMLLTFAYFTLVRWDGLDAAQRMETSWRWTPTKEQEFLASRGNLTENTDATADPTHPWTLEPGDCPEFRGPQRDGVVTGVKLVANWNEHPPKLLWRNRVGPGWSSLIIVDGHLVTQEQRGDAETVVCYDAASGSEIWVHEDAVRFEEQLSGAGPRATPTFADGRIYALGGNGKLNCLAAENGDALWSHDITAAAVAAAELPQWGYSVSPLVVDGLVVVFAGGTHDKSILAYRADNGELAWSRAAGKQTYSSPQLVTINGERQIVMHDNHGLTGFNIADGAVLWENPSASEMAMPMLQPHQTDSGDLIVSTEPGAVRLAINSESGDWSVTPQWTANTFRPGFSDFVLHKDHIYALDDGILCCFDAATGKRLWKKGRYSHGQVLLLADQDALVVASDTGEVILVSAEPKGHKELGRFQAIDGKTWNSPVLVGNRLFLRNGEEMAAYELKAEATSPVPVAIK